MMMSVLLFVVQALAAAQSRGAGPAPTIVFVCEHGAAKSVIATAYFNKLAAERRLPYRAMFRGTHPQQTVSGRALDGLRADGVPIPEGEPTLLGPNDIETATHIFAIGCALPDNARASGKAHDWSDIPETTYAKTRDAIRRRVERLLDDLQHGK